MKLLPWLLFFVVSLFASVCLWHMQGLRTDVAAKQEQIEQLRLEVQGLTRKAEVARDWATQQVLEMELQLEQLRNRRPVQSKKQAPLG